MNSKAATQNACKLCTPLGACLAYKGFEATMPLLHGSQGCATYIRRYTISHFREPVDIASTSFTEDSAVFGGGRNLEEALNNLVDQYQPKAIGLATTCLSETIGEDINLLLSDYSRANPKKVMPPIFRASTPSYQGTHAEGYWAAVGAVIEQLVTGERTEVGKAVVLTPGMVSPKDLRRLKRIFELYQIPLILLADYSETLDGGVWEEYQKMAPGGTSLEDVGQSIKALFALDLHDLDYAGGTAKLEEKGVPRLNTPLPIGLRLTDHFHRILREQSGVEVPKQILNERNRLLDAYTDGHKYCFGKKALVFGDADMVLSLAVFLEELGITPVLCATGAESSLWKEKMAYWMDHPELVQMEDNWDFEDLEKGLQGLGADFMIGNSKGYKISRALGLPLIRTGFPVHDRFGSGRIAHLDYSGSQELYDQIVNLLLEVKQENSEKGYTYL